MVNHQPNGSNRQSSATIQTTIHAAMAKISNQARRRALLPPRQSKSTSATEMSPVPSTSAASRNRIEPSTSKATTPVSNSTAASIQKQPSNKPNADTNAFETQLLDNSYARELFFRHTNIKEVVAKKLPDRSENTRQKYAPQLYRLYVLEPEQRIREHLHEVRFDTRISEGLLRMALKVPLTSEHDWNAHKATLARAGIRKLCFVDMTQNNCVLEYQEKVVRKLKAEFRHWSAKLNKLSSYLTMYQRQREAEERKFLSLLKHHSSLKGSWTLQLPVVVKELLQERWLPSEKRINLIWSELRFDDDHLNRKYEVGSYSKFRFNMEVDPEVVVEPTSLAIDPDSFAADDQRCITPVNVTSNRPPAVVHLQQETVTEEDETQVNQEIPTESASIPTVSVPDTQPADIKPTIETIVAVPQSENVPSNHQRFAVPVNTVRETIGTRDASVRTTNQIKSTASDGYTLQYVARFTNIYDLVIKNYLERNRDKNISFTQSKADNFVRKFYNLYKHTFARKELPDGVRMLTAQEQGEQATKGPLRWVMERINDTKAELLRSIIINNNGVQVVVETSVANPTPSNQMPTPPPPPPIPPRPLATNQPKPKQRKTDPILRIPCPIRTARIPYDSDSSLSLSDTAQHDDDDDTNEAAHHSIAFVSIEDDNVSQPLQQEQENTPLSEDFAPVASSTQNRSPLYRRRSTQLTELQSQPVATQDPLLLSGTSTTTIPPFHAIVPCESGSTHVFTPTNKQPTASTQSQSQPTSSIIPPFQVVNTNPDVPAVTTIDSSPVSSRASFVVKQEALSQLSADTSGYENEVQYVPNPDNLIVLSDSPEQSLINFSDFNKSIDSINTRVIGILARQDNERTENEHYLSCTEPTTSNSSLEGRSRLSVKVEPEADHAISPPRIGPYISFEAPRKTRHRQALATVPLAATTTPYIWSQNSHMMFLHRFYIQSVRYSSIPTTWSHSGMFQANPLTVHFNPYSAGLFSVPVCDQQACLLLMGMSAGTGSGTEALLAALAHVGKFRYGSKEPAREYYRLSITEKVLYLFFATIPPCPQDGGLVMYPKRKSSLPADGDEMWLEPFHYYAHMKPNKRQRSTDENGKASGNGNGGESLAKLLKPGIGLQMKALREKLLVKSGAIVV